MPVTFMRYFYIGANLRWLMTTVEWPDAAPFHDMMKAYTKSFRDAARSNPRLASLRPLGDETEATLSFVENAAIRLPDNLYRALIARISLLSNTIFTSAYADLTDHRPVLSDLVNSIPSYDYGGVRYSTKRAYERDSRIIFSGPHDRIRSIPRAGQIREIFVHARVENGMRIAKPFFVIDEYVSLSEIHGLSDPYRQFEDLGAWLFYNRFKPEPVLIALQDIGAHFAALVYQPEDILEECIIVRSLDRVRVFHESDWISRLMHSLYRHSIDRVS